MPSHDDYPALVLVGRTNVGKSTLFNRLIGRRNAIVHSQAETTRDCVEGSFSWEGRIFTLADTGGMRWSPSTSDITQAVARVREDFLKNARLILFVCDGMSGCLDVEMSIAQNLRKQRIPTVVVVNKIDHESATYDATGDFYKLGFKHVIFVSAMHGRGIGQLCDLIAELLPEDASPKPAEKYDFSLAILGEPNAGKSTLLNAIYGKEKAIVSAEPGTTRDPVRALIKLDGRSIRIIDTAGARRRRKVSSSTALFSQQRTRQVLREADIVLLLFDARTGLNRNSFALADEIKRSYRPCVLVINKWDLLSGVEQGKYKKVLEQYGTFLRHCPMVFISAKNKLNIEAPFRYAIRLWDTGRKRIEERKLWTCLRSFQSRHPLPSGGQIKFATQVGMAPPHFVFFVGSKKHVNRNYVHAIENELTRTFDLGGIFFKLTIKAKERKL